MSTEARRKSSQKWKKDNHALVLINHKLYKAKKRLAKLEARSAEEIKEEQARKIEIIIEKIELEKRKELARKKKAEQEKLKKLKNQKKKEDLENIAKKSRDLEVAEHWKLFEGLFQADQFIFLLYKQLLEISGNGHDWKEYCLASSRVRCKKQRLKPEHNTRRRERYRENIERERKRVRDWNAKLKLENPEKYEEILRKQRERHQRNREVNIAKNKIYCQKNKERLKKARYKRFYGNLWEVAKLTYETEQELRNGKKENN